jgi:hypothetical protein
MASEARRGDSTHTASNQKPVNFTQSRATCFSEKSVEFQRTAPRHISHLTSYELNIRFPFITFRYLDVPRDYNKIYMIKGSVLWGYNAVSFVKSQPIFRRTSRLTFSGIYGSPPHDHLCEISNGLQVLEGIHSNWQNQDQ